MWDTDEASPSGLAYLDGQLWLAALRGERLWRIDVDGDRASKPTDFFVGKYGRLRTVVVAPDGNLWVTTSQPRRPRRPRPRDDDRILVVDLAELTVARRAARRSVVSTAGPSTTSSTALVIARPVSQQPVEVSSV